MSRSPGATPLGVVGLGLALLSALAAFVVAMEYDPDAAAFLEHAAVDTGTVLRVDGDIVTIEIEATSIGPTEIQVDAQWRSILDPGDTVTVAYRPDRPGQLRLRDDLPQTPRTAGGFVVAIVLFALAAAAVGADPAVLYPLDREPEPGAPTDREATR